LRDAFSLDRLRALYALLMGGIAFYIWDQLAHGLFEAAGLGQWYSTRFLYDPGLPPCGLVNFAMMGALVAYGLSKGRRWPLMAALIPAVFSVAVLYASVAQYIFKNL